MGIILFIQFILNYKIIMDKKKILICSKIENYTQSYRIMELLISYGYDVILPFLDEYDSLKPSKKFF